MTWETYYDAYRNYITSASQTRLLTLTSLEVFADFPKNLPSNLRETWTEIIHFLGEMALFAKAYIEEGKTEYEGDLKLDRPVDTILDDPLYSIILSFISLRHSPLNELNFEMLLCHHELAMAIAHFEAFMADTMRAICRARPEVLRRKNQLDWKTIMTCGSWEKLTDYMIEQFTYKQGWGSLRQRIEFLETEFGVQLQFCEDDLQFLEEAERLRQIVIHNGGKVSQEFINRTERGDLVIGQLVPITPEYVEELYYTSRSVVSDIFRVIAKKFFDKQDSDLVGVWRPGQKENGTDDL